MTSVNPLGTPAVPHDTHSQFCSNIIPSKTVTHLYPTRMPIVMLSENGQLNKEVTERRESSGRSDELEDGEEIQKWRNYLQC